MSAREHLEPEALDGWRTEQIAAGNNTVNSWPTDYETQISVAISLRRIAEVLERLVAAPGHPTDLELRVHANCDVRQV